MAGNRPGYPACQDTSRQDNPKEKKILLTGKADHQTGIAAINEGVIDRFVRKGPSSIATGEQLHRYIDELHREWFAKQTAAIADALAVDRPSMLNHAGFTRWFQQLRDDVYPATRLNGTLNGYYCALIENPTHFAFAPGSLPGFQQYHQALCDSDQHPWDHTRAMRRADPAPDGGYPI